MKGKKIALIELASNAMKFAIYRIDDEGCYQEIEKVKEPVRLITHINKEGAITKEGIRLIISTIKSFKKTIRSYHVTHVIGFATAALRQSCNQAEVLEEIKRETNLSFSVLTEYEEAFYGFLGVKQSMHIQDGITLDIGGGSTEITLFQNKKIVHYHSFPFGAVTLHETFTKGKNVKAGQVTALRSYLFSEFNHLSWLDQANLPIIGIGGSARNIVQMLQASKKAQPCEITHREIDQLFDKLAALSEKKRATVKGLSKKRTDTIVPAVQLVTVLMEVVHPPHFIYCEKTIRDGIIKAWMAQYKRKEKLV